MPYSVSIDDLYFQSLSFNTLHNSHLDKTLSCFPPSYVNYIKNINSTLPEDNQFKDIENVDYRYINNRPSVFPKVFNATYTLKSSSDFYSYYNSTSSFSITKTNTKEIYPIAVRYTNGKNIWLIERPPFQATVTFRPTSSSSTSDKYKTYTMWMPWTVMLLNIDFESSYYDAYLFLNDGPLESLQDNIVPCFFPNIYADGRMCLNQTSIGLQQHLAQTKSFDISTVYNYIINDYMSGGWNMDLGSTNFDTFLNHPVGKSFTALRSLQKILLDGDSYLKIKPLSTPYSRLTYKRKISVLLTYFSSLNSDQVLDIVRESKRLSKSFTPEFAIQRLETTNSGDFSFTQLFSGFERQVSSKYTSDYHVILNPSITSTIIENVDYYTLTYTQASKDFLDKLLSFISENSQNHKDEVVNSDFYTYFNAANINPYIYANSLDSFSFIPLDDTSFIFDSEKSNV